VDSDNNANSIPNPPEQESAGRPGDSLDRLKKKKHRRKALWFILADAFLLLFILGLTAILFFHKPAGYTPEELADINSNEISPYLTHTVLASFYNGVEKGVPFTMELEQGGINDIIARICPWPQSFAAANSSVLQFAVPMVSFEPNVVQIMSNVHYDGIETVVTVEARPLIDAKGRMSLGITSVKAGALPITFVVKKMAHKMYDEQIGDMATPDDWLWKVLGSALADKDFDPVFDFDRKKIRIDRIEIAHGKAQIHVIPVRH
jgi:hypothetical protein